MLQVIKKNCYKIRINLVNTKQIRVKRLLLLLYYQNVKKYNKILLKLCSKRKRKKIVILQNLLFYIK